MRLVQQHGPSVAAAIGLATVGVGLVIDPFLSLFVVAACLALLILPLARNDSVVWFAACLLMLSATEAALPNVARLALSASLALVAALALNELPLRGPSAIGRTQILSLFVFAWWILEMANSNIPDLTFAGLGLRKSVFLFVGLWLGILVARRLGSRVVLTFITWLLAGSLVVALILHNFAPTVEQSITRNADVATATYGGVYRLAGTFSGPFHAALASAALVTIAVADFVHKARAPFQTAVLLVVGSLALLQTDVRSGFVGLAAAVLYVLVINPEREERRILRTLTAAGGFLLASLLAFRLSSSVASLAATSSDVRFQGRFISYDDGLRLLRDRPFFGYGSGSAGDTLSTGLFGGVHITSHDLILKYAIEGGVIGLVLVCALLVSIWIGLRKAATKEALVARGLLVLLLVMGVTGSVVEALPVSFWLLVVMGACLVSDERGTKSVLVPVERRTRST